MTGSHSGPGGTDDSSDSLVLLNLTFLNHAKVFGGTIHFMSGGAGSGAMYGKLFSTSSG
jgi:hypothetical protein